MLQKTAKSFAECELKPIAAELDRKHKFPHDQVSFINISYLLIVVGIHLGKKVREIRIIIC